MIFFKVQGLTMFDLRLMGFLIIFHVPSHFTWHLKIAGQLLEDKSVKSGMKWEEALKLIQET